MYDFFLFASVDKYLCSDIDVYLNFISKCVETTLHLILSNNMDVKSPLTIS